MMAIVDRFFASSALLGVRGGNATLELDERTWDCPGGVRCETRPRREIVADHRGRRSQAFASGGHRGVRASGGEGENPVGTGPVAVSA